MNSKFALRVIALVFGLSVAAGAAPKTGRYFDRAIFVIFENTNYLPALQQPFFKTLANQGANFSNFTAITHPSQGNYIALTSGDLNGVRNDDPIDLNVRNIVDLLEAKGLTWKVYAEDYPGNCFKGVTSGNYARRHNPFISYVDIQNNPARCSKIVPGSEFAMDEANGTLPNYAFYIPNVKNDGHDTGVAFANQWYQNTFSPFLNSPHFLDDTVLISTFDESGVDVRNHIYLNIVGHGVKSGTVTQPLNQFSLLKLMEDNWDLGDFGKRDKTAVTIPNIWQ